MRIPAIITATGLLIVATGVGGKLKEVDYLPAVQSVPMAMVANAPGDPALEQAIKDLSSDDWRTREQAGRNLAARGEKALPYMRRALLATDNPEVQRRLSVLVRKMDRERLVEPKRVTLSAKNRTAKEIIDEIAKQTGYKIDFTDQNTAKYSFEFNKTPFLEAIDTVANAAGFVVYSEYEDDTIRVYNQDSTNPYVAYAGPFRFVATNIQSSRNVQLSGLSKRGNNLNTNDYMSLSFQIQSEPKNPMIGTMQPEILEAKDDLGGSLLAQRERNGYQSNYLNGGYRGHNTYLSANLTRGDRNAKTIKSLKGRVAVVLLSGTMPEVVIADPLKVKKKTFTGRSSEVQLDSVEEDANQKGVYLVNVTVKRISNENADPNNFNARNDDYMWANNVHQKLELQDDKGNRFFSYGPQSSTNNGTSIQLVMQFGPDDRRTGRPGAVKPGAPTRLILNEWLTVTHEVTFEFKDIPLP
jgi:hypothetical protein